MQSRSSLFFFVSLFLSAHVAVASDAAFRNPSKDELKMTELAGYPGAAAVVLDREETDNDDQHTRIFYERVKVLTEAGKSLANVNLPVYSLHSTDASQVSDSKDIADIQARTIHSDGSIVVFTGKPYMRTVSKTEHDGRIEQLSERVFTLPDVEVGSILEYRYVLRMGNNDVYEAPDWIIQGPYFLREAHYKWMTSTHTLVSGESGDPITSISWFPILPAGVKVVQTDLPNYSKIDHDVAPRMFEVSVKNVPPAPDEERMPPISSFTYRVLFNFSEYRTPTDFWNAKGREWSKRIDSFAETGGSLTGTVREMTAGANSQEAKLRKIYAAVETLENTDYTRERGAQEDRAQGLGKIGNAEGVWQHKRGNSEQIAGLFLAMARSAGMQAYAMRVPDRSVRIFTPLWLNADQFDATVVLVRVDGTEVAFDPGERYVPYGHLAWQHTFVQGQRQVDGGTAFTKTAGDGFDQNDTSRVANLTMDTGGVLSGRIDITYQGAAALQWRQAWLGGDDRSLQDELCKALGDMLPPSLSVEIHNVENLSDYEHPLVVHFEVKGALPFTGAKRVLVPADLFVSREEASFPQSTRETAVYFAYPQTIEDALRLRLPATLAVEASPSPAKAMYGNEGAFQMTVDAGGSSVDTRREYEFTEFIVPQSEYGDLRKFYLQMEAKDGEPIVLKSVTPAE